MKNKLIITAGVLLLVTCVVLGIKIIQSDDSPVTGIEADKDNRSGSLSSLGNTGEDGSTRPSRGKSRPAQKGSDLIERFGEARTGLSKKVTTDLAGIFEDSIKLADMGAKMRGGQDMREVTARQTLEMLARRLELTDEQKAQAEPIIAQAIEARFEAFNELTSSMKDSPEPIMELFLYGDAAARGEITQEEYEAATAGTRTMLENATNTIMGRGTMSFDDNDPLTNQLSGILTPTQREEMTGMNGGETSDPPARRGVGRNLPFQGEIPAMELEQLDRAVSSARVMTSGMQQVMQGLEGLQQNFDQE